jgi:hypothetical protein
VTVPTPGRRALTIVGVVCAGASLAVAVGAVAAHFLGQAVLESMVGLLGAIVLLGVS